MVLDFIIGEVIVLVEETENYSLIAVDNEDVLLLTEEGLEFDLSMLEEPCEIPVAVLMLIELLKLGSALLHLLGKGASSSILFRPMSIGEDFSRELDSIDYSIGVLLLEGTHEVLGEGDINEHLRDLVNCVVAAFNL